MNFSNSRPPRDPREQRGPRGPFCQSCGMPMLRPEKFGTEASGEASRDFCCFCYKEGAFTEPSITKEQMLQKVTRIMVQRRGMPEEKAESMANNIVPRLKRWTNN